MDSDEYHQLCELLQAPIGERVRRRQEFTDLVTIGLDAITDWHAYYIARYVFFGLRSKEDPDVQNAVEECQAEITEILFGLLIDQEKRSGMQPFSDKSMKVYIRYITRKRHWAKRIRNRYMLDPKRKDGRQGLKSPDRTMIVFPTAVELDEAVIGQDMRASLTPVLAEEQYAVSQRLEALDDMTKMAFVLDCGASKAGWKALLEHAMEVGVKPSVLSRYHARLEKAFGLRTEKSLTRREIAGVLGVSYNQLMSMFDTVYAPAI